MTCENRLSLTLGGVVPRDLNDLDGLQASEFETYQIVEKNDLIFKLIDLQNIRTSRVGLVHERGIMSPAYIRLSGRDASVDPAFAYWYFTDLYNRHIFNELGGGVRQTIGPEELLLLPFPVLPRAEQSDIASFLARETEKIDGLTSEQQSLAKLLKEKRQAVISHAVTKGLNPDAPMKASGAECLGDVPAMWSVSPLKRLLDDMKAGPFGSSLTKDRYVSEGYRVYGQEQVIHGDFSLGDYYIDQDVYDELNAYSVAPGDVLISCVGTFGKVALVPNGIEPGIINPRLMRVRCSPALMPTFLVLLMTSLVVFEQLAALSRGGTMDVINLGTVGQIVIPVPPLPEQAAIVNMVQRTNAATDRLIRLAERAIVLLSERRTALISAAVTGKIDVRHLTDAEAA